MSGGRPPAQGSRGLCGRSKHWPLGGARRTPSIDRARARIEKGAAILLLRSLEPDPTFVDCRRVESVIEVGRFYSVDLGVGVCECPDHQHRNIRCGHLWALKLYGALARMGRPAIAPVAA